ncbi:MAG: rhomboid family intramembrane serine protease [Goleter apudmare HA4340-LM2]|jgi:membrane associated rhomboid family serine protease|nr:rhomboid family intramembrane serine protease [Goleter apudmare HA4340-LM2]
MIPIKDSIYHRNQPIINYWLIGINVAIFLWEIHLELGDKLGYFVNQFGVIPAQITSALTNAIFSNSAAWVVVIWSFVSLVSGIFLHGSFSQILGNLLFLWVFGKTVENYLGRKYYLGLYLLAGVLTGVAQIIIEPNLTVPLIGANGAIASVLGAYLIKFPQTKIYTILPLLVVYIPLELPAFFYLFWWFIQQSFYGIGNLHIPPVGVNQPSIAYWMQVVGLFIGAAFMHWKK